MNTARQVTIELMAQKIHRNESMHRHGDHDKPTCSYCTNVATLAASVLDDTVQRVDQHLVELTASALREGAEELLRLAHHVDGEDR